MWGPAVSGSVASRRALVGYHGRRSPDMPVWVESRSDWPFPTDRVRRRRRTADAALASPHARPSRPRRLPCPKSTKSLSKRRASVRVRHRHCPATSAVVNPSMVSEAPSTPPLAAFSPGTREPELPLPLHPDAGPRRPPEPLPRRRMPPPSWFFHPSRRQEAPVSNRLHPLARRVASPPWVLERLPLPHLCHGSAAAGCVVMRARRAETAPVCARTQRRGVMGRVGRGRQSRGSHALCKRAELTLRTWATRGCATGPSADSAQWQSN
jgi:hypothetical protein